MRAEDRETVLDRLATQLEEEARAGTVAALRALGALEASLRDPARPEDAYLWFALAAALGDVTAPQARDHVAAALSPDQRAEVQARLKEMHEIWPAKP